MAFAVALIGACSTSPGPKRSDASYLPLKKGIYQVYDVDSAWYTVNGMQEEHYELLTEVVDSFPNTEGGYTYVIYRYKRPDAGSEWSYHDTWSARVSGHRVIVSEASTAFVKFTLPVIEGAVWNGNAFNDLGVDDYEMLRVGIPYTVDGTTFDDCAEVSQNDDDDMIVRTDIRKEVYARDVGLIRREIRILNYCTAGCNVFGEIESGVEYTQTIKEYGVR
ncbi:MAG: hypothetical protein DIU61_008540 [Bacteroidota bacterium]|jgi:hypothetical protein|nr:MAG: hypothetical protein DIU61_09360 [Bacteroidota bacterium]